MKFIKEFIRLITYSNKAIFLIILHLLDFHFSPNLFVLLTELSKFSCHSLNFGSVCNWSSVSLFGPKWIWNWLSWEIACCIKVWIAEKAGKEFKPLRFILDESKLIFRSPKVPTKDILWIWQKTAKIFYHSLVNCPWKKFYWKKIKAWKH